MEHTLRAPSDGTVELLVATGDRVGVDQVVARVTAPAPAPAPEAGKA
jgi:acetyl-CoA/propionyl-CoA carboxylase biotin carboxyl carrier protein